MAQMHWYSTFKNSINDVKISPEAVRSIRIGEQAIGQYLSDMVMEYYRSTGFPCVVALDGYLGAEWLPVVENVRKILQEQGFVAEVQDTRELYRPRPWMESLIARYTDSDPTLGTACTDKCIEDLLAPKLVQDAVRKMRSVKKRKGTKTAAFFCHGIGAASHDLYPVYDRVCFFDVGRVAVTMRKFAGTLREPYLEYPQEVSWKKEMYFYYHIMDKYRTKILSLMDHYIDGNDADHLKLIPRSAYDDITGRLSEQPLKFRRFMQPGNWGGLHHSKYFNLPELKNCAWDTTFYGPKNTLLVDVGINDYLEIPFLNVQNQYPLKIVGPYLHKKYPGLLPMIACIDDGYFPKPVHHERSNMPIHLHPDGRYAQKTFNERLGRYETYYIVEAYENANTMLGLTKDADVEEFKQKIIDADKNKIKFDWTKYVKTWLSQAGDLYLIPAGTVHGTGGHQMILEMDTCPSNTGTEYSFFIYDFLRPSWDDDKKEFCAPPVRLQIKHGINQARWYRRENWVRKNLLAKPHVIRKGDGWCEDRYDSYGPMPFLIERLHFDSEITADTEGKYCHLIMLTQGEKVQIRSKLRPEKQITLEWIQFALIPAGFGEYECLNMGKSPHCTIVKQRWKKG